MTDTTEIVEGAEHLEKIADAAKDTIMDVADKIADVVGADSPEDIDWGDVAIHFGIAAGVTALLSLTAAPLWLCAFAPTAVFYSREQTQQQYRNNPPTGFKAWLPPFWGPHGQSEFYAPAIAAVLTAIGAWILF